MDEPLPPDPYVVLGVDKHASLPSIRSAYRKLVLTCHPDKVQDPTLKAKKVDEFQRVQQAYEILSDDQKLQQYKDQVRLAELRREVLERQGSRGPRVEIRTAAPPPGFDARSSSARYEPPRTRSYEWEEEASYSSPRYAEESRASSRKHPGYDSTHPRTSRPTEERKSSRVADETRYRETRERVFRRESDRTSHAQSDRRRTREKRRDYDDKYDGRHDIHVETESESDDDRYRRDDEYRRKEEYREPPRREPPRKKEEDFGEAIDHKTRAHEDEARNYILRSKTAGAAYRTVPHTTQYFDARRSEPPPPRAEPARRASTRRTQSRDREPPREAPRERSRARSSTRKASADIVDPPPVPKIPHLHASTSSPASIPVPGMAKGPAPPQRSSTMHYPAREAREPLQRSTTTPLSTSGIPPRRSEAVPSPTTKLKSPIEPHDSGYSSPGTPETPQTASAKQPQYTKYIYQDPEDMSSGPRIVPVDPDYRRQRSTPERPTLTTQSSSASKHGAGRSASYVTTASYSAEPPPTSRPSAPMPRPKTTREVPTSSRPESARPSVSRVESSTSRTPTRPLMSNVSFSPSYSAKDVLYTYGNPQDREDVGYGRTHADMSRSRGAYRMETIR
ncbi:MAG: hypothetical protein M1819_003841 [Sarea resinae]|nr:MAG: hypothetical protein M1819_003841 [Sarea resinae]